MNILRRIVCKRRGFSGPSKIHAANEYPFVLHSSFIHTAVEVHSPEEEVVIALGSNVGDRLKNLNEALQLMKKSGIQITRHGCLYETAPAYVLDQPQFLNSAVRAITRLGPHELLQALKKIEQDLGRIEGIRYGPRPIDLDILFYGKFKINSNVLTVPHERIWERPFVMAPLVDLLGLASDSDAATCWHSLAPDFGGLFESWEKLGGESLIGNKGLRRVLPVGNDLWDWSKKTSVMGILNVTPDSFSDGGKFQAVDDAISQIRLMIFEGADMIDIGAQSTRPMARRISAEEELDRLIPILEAALEIPEMNGKLLSVDTFHSEVALEAIKKGAHIINDISSGQLDTNMHKVVAALNVPYIAMHMRGDPSTMQNDENLKYTDVCDQIGSELYSRIRDAELSGIPAWRIIVDPGIGFSKNTEQNLEILMNFAKIRSALATKSYGLSRAPLLIGPSRKRFLGEVCSISSANERDYATVASTSVGVLGGANIVRVHNVRANSDAVKLCDSMLKLQKRK